VSDDLEAAIDRLYELPPAQFTEARNALAAERKKAGDAAAATRVKGLLKPSAVAWAVNQVYFRDRPAFDGLANAMAEVAAAQREALTGGVAGSVRDAMRRKTEALAAAARLAERRLVEGGAASSPAVLQRLTSTLEALARPRAAGDDDAPRPGRLATELQAPGFDLALGLRGLDLPPPPPRSPAPSPSAAEKVEEDPAARDRAAGRRLAEGDVGRARREIDAAVQALGEAEARTAAANADVATLRARLAEAQARADRHAAAEDEARRRLEGARAARAAAEARLLALSRSSPD
jgi:hypothetical protein